jgi:hypothetical protein
MTTKMTFVDRRQEKDTQSNIVDAQKIIDYFLSLDPNNRIIPNSPLYNVAVKQYNDNVKTTTVRPPVPNWFCGKVDAATGELLTSKDDEEMRASGGYSSTVINPYDTTAIILSAYDPDGCLENGTPGSFGYSKCSDTLQETIETSGIDWYVSTLTEVGGEEFVTETPDADSLHKPIYSTSGATEVAEDSGGGLVWNPDSSRGTAKIIFPSSYSGTISNVYAWGDGYKEEYYRKEPNENGNRQRYYGRVPIEDLPKQITVRCDRNVGGSSRDVYIKITDTQKRHD